MITFSPSKEVPSLYIEHNILHQLMGHQAYKTNPMLFPCNKLRQIFHLRKTRKAQTMLRTLHTEYSVEYILLAL